MQASMSRRGNCFDTPIESFWGTLKSGLVYHRRFATRQQAKQEITGYIEVFYNRQRTQARLDYLSPAAFTQRFYLKIAAQPVGVHEFRPTLQPRTVEPQRYHCARCLEGTPFSTMMQ